MPESDAARMSDSPADHSSALSRLGLLIETVTASVARISSAPSVIEALPDVLATLARVVHIDRVVMVESPQQLLFNWTAPEGSATPLGAEALIPAITDPELQAWVQPLAQGLPVVTMRGSAPVAVKRFLSKLGVLTALMVPIMVEGRPWGRICFDDCEREHLSLIHISEPTRQAEIS